MLSTNDFRHLQTGLLQMCRRDKKKEPWQQYVFTIKDSQLLFYKSSKVKNCTAIHVDQCTILHTVDSLNNGHLGTYIGLCPLFGICPLVRLLPLA